MPNGYFFGDLDELLPPENLEKDRDALRATQDLAGDVEPDIAAHAAQVARERGVPMQAVLDSPQPKQKEDWGKLAGVNPVLARHLQRLEFARVAQKDTGALAKVEELLRTGKESGKVAAEVVKTLASDTAKAAKRGWRTGELARVAARQRDDALAGKPHDVALEAQARELEQYADAGEVLANIDNPDRLAAVLGGQTPERGYLHGIIPGTSEQIALMASRGLRFVGERAAKRAEAEATAPSAEGGTYARRGTGRAFAEDALLAGTNPAPMALQGADDEGALFFREALAKGASPRAAAEMSRFVSVINGSLEFLPVANLMKRIPGLSAMGGTGVRDLMRKVISSPTRMASVTRLLGRMAEQGLAEGSTEYLQEWTNILAEPMASGKPMASLAEGHARASKAFVAGSQAGLGLGAAGNVATLVEDLREAKTAKRMQAWANELAAAVSESSTARRDPVAVAEMANDAVAEGKAPPTVSFPASTLRELFQGEGITDEDVRKKMPKVADAMANATAMDDPDVEVAIPTGDFAAHVAGLKGLPAAAKKMRVGDTLTLEEAEAVEKMAKETKPEAGEEQLTPAQRVFEDVFTKAKGTVDQRRTAAALWAAMSESRASRGVAEDAWAYYQKQTLDVREGEATQGLAQTDPAMDPESIIERRTRELAADPEALTAAYWRDPVTGVYSGRAVNALPVTPQAATVGVIDFEGFKPANDYGGHVSGDTLLQLAASALHGKAAWVAKVGNTLHFSGPDAAAVQQLYKENIAGLFPENKIQTALSTFDRTPGAAYREDQSRAKGDRDARRDAGTFSSRQGIPVAFLEKDSAGERIFRVSRDKYDPAKRNPYHTKAEKAAFVSYLRGLEPKARKVEAMDVAPELRAKQAATDLEQQARDMFYDRDTGLLNEAGWDEVRRVNPRAWVMSADLVGLRDTDQTFGHGPTDNLLDAVSDVVARVAEDLGVDAAHKHGDEYAFQADSEVQMTRFRNALREELRGITFVVEKDGKVLVQEGVLFGAGIDKDWQTADTTKLDADKAKEKPNARKPRELAAGEADPRNRGDLRRVDVGLEQPGVQSRTGRRPLQGRLAPAGGSVQGSGGGAAPEGQGVGGEARTSLSQTGKGKRRGSIVFDAAATAFTVTLTKRANLSTFFHESGHAFFEMLQRDARDGHEESAVDVALVRDFLGAEGEGPLTEAQLEKFARAFEAYLWEGKSPAPKLDGVFSRLKAWMRHVYRSLRSLDVELDDRVRQVFDRLLATEEEIQAQAARLMLDGGVEGSEAHAKALAEAQADLEAEALSTLRAAVREDYARVKAEVAEEDAADQTRNARLELEGKERLDGAGPTAGLNGRKLDRESLHAMGLDGETLRRLRSVSEMPGESVSSVIQPDDAAFAFGYESAQDFVRELADRPSRQAFIEAETDRRMDEIYPGFRLTPAWLEEHALKALHGRAVETALMADLAAAGRQIGAPPARSVREIVKRAAQAEVDRSEINALDPERYRRQEVAAAKAWQEAMASQDFATAHTAKRRQLYAHFAWRAAAKAKDAAENQRATLRGFEDIRTRKKVGLAGPEYLQALDALLAGVELVKLTKKDAAAWTDALAAVEADGADVMVSPEVRAGVVKPWARLTVDEARAVYDAAQSIVHAAQQTRKIQLGKQKLDFADTVARLSAHVEARVGVNFGPGETQNAEGLAVLAKGVRASLAQLKKFEFIAMALDGGDTAGFAHSLLFQPLVEAEKAEVLLLEKTAVKFRELLDGLDQKRLTAQVDFLGTKMRRHEVIAVALNTGNEGNFQRLVDGYAERGWTREAVLQRLDQLLNDQEVAFVNEAWGLTGSMWPEVKALAERVVGVPPEAVDATPHTLGSGRQLVGGYYPIVKDRDRSNLGEKMAARSEALFEGSFMAPVVEAGFTKSRAVKTTDPLLLDLRVMPRHLKRVAHYVTHYEAIKAVDRLTQNKEVATTLRAAVSPEVFNEIRPALAAVANGGAVLDAPADFIDKVLRHLRLGATITMYGAKFTSGLMQATGLTSAVERLGPKYVVRGLHRFFADLAQGKPFEDAAKESEAIRRAEWNLDVDLNGLVEETLSQWGSMARFRSGLTQFSLAWMGLVQKSVNTVVFHAAREKALAEGHPDPAAFADSAVRTTQSAAGVKDLARIQRGSETKRLFTVAYSYFSVFQNLLMLPLDAEGAKKVPAAAARVFWLVTLPVLLETALRGKAPPKGEDEPEDWLKYLTLQQLTYAARGVPLMSSVAEQLLDPKNEARTAPWLTATFKGAKAAHAALTEDRPLSPSEVKDIGTLAGMAAKVPVPALFNLYRWASTLDAQTEPTRNLLLRSPGEFK